MNGHCGCVYDDKQIGTTWDEGILCATVDSQVIKAAGVKRIKFHGLRHTSATLLLKARTPVHVVSERLGHSKVSMTMEIYAHVLPAMQEEAATALGAILHG